jgi:hypothetical protein
MTPKSPQFSAVRLLSGNRDYIYHPNTQANESPFIHSGVDYQGIYQLPAATTWPGFDAFSGRELL